MYLTLSDSGVKRLAVHGPKGISRFIQVIFARNSSTFSGYIPSDAAAECLDDAAECLC